MINVVLGKDTITLPVAAGREYLLVAGGRPPAVKWLLGAAAGRVVVCADRGVSYCRAAGIRPVCVLGDGDSAGEDWAWAEREGATMFSYAVDKEATDLQLALQFIAGRADCSALVATGVWGGRFDHAFSAMFSLADFAEQRDIPVVLADGQEALLFVAAGCSLCLLFIDTPEVISMLPCRDTCLVNLSGVHWPLKAATLKLLQPYAISNRPAGEQLNIAVDKGLVGLYVSWQADI